MTRPLTDWLPLAALFIVPACQAQAQEMQQEIPEVSARVGLWNHDRDLNGETWVAAAAAHARLTLAPAENVGLFGEGYVQVDSTEDAEADLREGWVRVRARALEMKIGRQVIVWGRADRLNPTDVLGARDYTRLLVSDDEQRRGLFIAQANYALGDYTTSLLWLPEFRSSRFPLERDRPGVLVLDDEQRRDRGQFAAKLDRSGGALDWSLSYFRGIDRNRDIVLTALPHGSPPDKLVAVQQRFADIAMVGADLAGTAGRIGYRAEIAYTHVRGSDSIYRRNDSLWLVAGADTSLEDGWNLNVQYSLRRVFRFDDPADIVNPVARSVALQSAAVNNQLDRYQNGLTLRVARKWLNDTLDFELSTAGYLETGDVAVRPKLAYAFSDRLRGQMGADLFAGPELSYYGRVQKLSAAYLSFVYGF